MFNVVSFNRKQDLEIHQKSGNEDSGDMSEEEEEEEEEVGVGSSKTKYLMWYDAMIQIQTCLLTYSNYNM